MINSVEIKNFQSHKHTKLDFDKGINAIVGSSDSGKSAILRALNLVINNKPSGDAYRSDWGGDTFVEIEYDKHCLRRTRTTTANEYCLDGSYFKALGGKVPEEIEQSINMGDLNIQFQLDAPFLLNETPGQVAQRLNKTVNLDVIDEVVKKVNHLYTENASNLKSDQRRLEEKKLDIEKYNKLDDIEKRLDVLEQEYNLICETYNRNNFLKSLKNDYEKQTVLKESLEPIVKKLNYFITKLEVLQTDKELVESREKQLQNTISMKNSYETFTKDKENLIEKVKQLSLTIAKIEKGKEKLEVISNKIKRIDSTIEEVNDSLYNYTEITKKIDKLKLEIMEGERQFKEMIGNKCPLCGQDVIQ